MGVIIRVDRDVVRVLDQNGIVKTVRLQELGPKKNNKMATSVDSKHNGIVSGDYVQVCEGPMKVLYQFIYFYYLFIYYYFIILIFF